MTTLAWIDEPFSMRLVETLSHFLWQGCAIVGLALCLHWRPRATSSRAGGIQLVSHSARVRYLINVVAMMLMVGCLPVTFALVGETRNSPNKVERFESIGMGFEEEANAKRVDRHGKIEDANFGSSDGSRDVSNQTVFHTHPKVTELNGSTNAEQLTLNPAALKVNPSHSWLQSSASYLIAVYGVGVVLMLARVTISLWGGQRLRWDADAIGDSSVKRMLERQIRLIGMRSRPTIAVSGRIAVPVVHGVIKPIILLPIALTSGLTSSQLRAILTHELAHIQRFDLVINLLQRLVEALLFFHPAVWFLSRRISTERERAADDLVVSVGERRVDYADALVRVAELSVCGSHRQLANHAAVLAASGENTSELKRRVLRLLDEDCDYRPRLTRAGLLLFFAVSLVTLFSPLLVHAWGQKQAAIRVNDSKKQARAKQQESSEHPKDSNVANVDSGKINASQNRPSGELEEIPKVDQELLSTIDKGTIFECKKVIRDFDTAKNLNRAAEARERLANRLEQISKQPVSAFTRALPKNPSGFDSNLVGVQTNLDGKWSTGKGTADSWKDWIVRKQKAYRVDRLRLLFEAAQLYRKTDRLKSARRVLELGLESNEIYDQSTAKLIKKYWPINDDVAEKSLGTGPHAWTIIGFLRELAPVQYELHDLDHAIESQMRLTLANFFTSWDAPAAAPTQHAQELWRMIRERRKLPKILFWFNVLSEKNNSVTFDLSDSGKRGTILGSHDENIAAIPTHDFKELKIAAKFHGKGGFLSCYYSPPNAQRKSIAVIGRDRPVSDSPHTVIQTIKVPAGVGLIQFVVRGQDERVGHVTVEAKFKQRPPKLPTKPDHPKDAPHVKKADETTSRENVPQNAAGVGAKDALGNELLNERYIVLISDGRVLTGKLIKHSKESIVLRVNNKDTTVPRDEIDTLRRVKKK